MYLIIDYKTNVVIEKTLNPTFVKQQKLVDFPIGCNGLFDADGIVLSDGVTTLGIEGRNMQNYTPTVIIEEVSSEPYILDEINKIKSKLGLVQNDIIKVYDVQTEGSVPKTELDNAYQEGVNSVE